FAFLDPNSPKKDIPKENAAALAMMSWPSLLGQDAFNLFYVTGADSGPQQFMDAAAGNGKNSINLFFGHGSGDSDPKNLINALNQLNATGQERPLYGIGSCFAAVYNSKIPDVNQIPGLPGNTGEIYVGQAPQYW